MYELIMKSHKNNAVEFQKWVYQMIKSIRQDYGYNAWEVICMMSVEDSKLIREEYKDICEDLDISPNYANMGTMCLKLVCYYYDVEYIKGCTNINTFRETEYPNIIHDRKRISDLFLRYFAMTGSHSKAFEKAKNKLDKEIEKYNQ